MGGRKLSDFEAGFLVGLLVGEGHFGGDGRQPQVTLRMHTDHAAVFSWLVEHVPGGRLYGPYEHAGRRYYQWMARGPFLRDELVPVLDRHLRAEHSQRVYERFRQMKERFGLGPVPSSPAPRHVRVRASEAAQITSSDAIIPIQPAPESGKRKPGAG